MVSACARKILHFNANTIATTARQGGGDKSALSVSADSRMQRRETSRAVRRPRRGGRARRGRTALIVRIKRDQRRGGSARANRDGRRAVLPTYRGMVMSHCIKRDKRARASLSLSIVRE